MEFGGRGIVESLRDQTILITGSTGFLAKVFVEKVLRVQPDVKKLYLVVRAKDDKSASQRLQDEVIEKELFRVLKEKHGDTYQSFVSSKLYAVAGDISKPDLGIEDSNLKQTMWDEITTVINVAATTSFDERYEVALGINTLGAKHALQFAKNCSNIQLLLHVSTAYVAGAKEGLLLEKKFSMNESLNGVSGLDIDEEVKLAEETLVKLQSEGSTEEEQKNAMKELGMDRSKKYGWPNTYVFTKAMGEMVLGHMRGDLPLVIVRPAIITSLYKDPVPGWMEGSRTIDSLIIGYAKAKLSCFLGDVNLIMDVIPGDMVINAMIVAMVAHSNQPSEHIYHVSSSVSNPVRYTILLDCGHRYFCENPRVSKNGKILKTTHLQILSTMASFRRYMTLRYKFPLQCLGLVNAALFGLFSQRYKQLTRRYNFVMHLVELYEPYAFFKGCFDDSNLEKLRVAAANDISADEMKVFWFDPKLIDWDNYFHDVHIPGVLKYVCR